MKKTYAVFGLGRYGRAVATELTAGGAEVLAVDINDETVTDAAADLPICKCADVTDPEVIKRLGTANIDTVIVAMAANLEASVMATILCKEAGVKTVITKCANDIHRKIYEKIGADKVIIPEKESGKRLAKNLLSSGFIDLVELSDNISMAELDVRDEWVGKSPAALDLRKKYSINIVAVKSGDTVETSIDPQLPLTKETKLIVIADTSKLDGIK